MSRPNAPTGQQQPVSFKTVPGRNRTQKWQQAKTYNYDGDEWGGFDPYDEYGSYDEPGPSAPAPAPMYAQQPRRQNSFDAGDERRAFSGPQPGYGMDNRRPSPAVSNSSGGMGGRPSAENLRGRKSSDYERRARQRNFTNPEQVPPPLNMHSNPLPSAGQPTGAFPPRKSSVSSGSLAQEPPNAPSPAKSMDKPLPLIRPSDIYKRMAEDKERQSMESSRPSMDSVRREGGPSSPTERQQSLQPVVERGEPAAAERSGSLSDVGPDSVQQAEYRPLSSLQQRDGGFGEPASKGTRDTSPVLPPVSRISGFGSDFLHGSGGEAQMRNDRAQTPTSPQEHVESTIARVMSAPLVGSSNEPSVSTQSTRAPPGQDPAGDILAERQHAVPVEAVGSNDLHHQPSTASAGFRSAVNTAFDRQDDNSVPPTPISRDGSQSMGIGSGVGRSDTTSTAGISPIMSRVPSAATTQLRQQVPPIAEEPSSATTPTHSRVVSGSSLVGSSTQHQIPRKPSPASSRSPSADPAAANVRRGYRRSLEPPSQANSPARTPALEDVANKRLSTPMAAETIAPVEEPDVVDQGAEMPAAHLEPAETPASEIDEPMTSTSSVAAAADVQTRGRSGTNYSVREADMADTVNMSPEQSSYSPPVAEAATATQNTFLRTHTSSPTSPSSPGFGRSISPGIASQGLGIMRVTTPGSMNATSGRDSPAKSRVREIAQNYNTLDSRRNSATSMSSSKSSWSNFRGSDENLASRRKGTGGSSLANEDGSEAVDDELDGMGSQYDRSQGESGPPTPQAPAAAGGLAVPDAERPGVASQASFRPHLPGEWVSYAATPAGERPPSAEQRRGSASPVTPRAGMDTAEEPIDLTPTTKAFPVAHRDFTPNPRNGSQQNGASALTQVKDAGAALGASLMATAGLNSQTRDFGSADPAPPVSQPEMAPKVPYGDVSYYLRPSLPREESETTDAPTSAASSVPPTPPAKDTPKPNLDVPGEREAEVGPDGRPVSSYFSGVIPPLRTRHSKDGVREDGQQRPAVLPTLSTDTGAEDMESDRLRKEIVRSLDPINKEWMKRESIMEEADRTQDALDAPDNERRVERGEKALPAAEARPAPRMLDQRFSWEGAAQPQRALSPPRIEEPESPEIKPEAPWERPRSRGLHIMNEDLSDVSPTEDSPEPRGESPLVSPITKSQEDLRPIATLSEDGMQHVEPSPIDEGPSHESFGSLSARIPSYYHNEAGTTPPAPEEAKEEEALPSTPSTAKRQSGGQRVPGFRDILAIKSGADRIKAYDSTRQTFADMDTGLSAWLSGMLAQHPEHANLSTATAKPLGQNSTAFRHKHSPSILKITKNFGSGADAGNTNNSNRKTSVSSPGPSEDAAPPKTPGGREQRGKDLMKTAGVLGGKAQAGAKGLFQRGKSRFGRDKV